MKRFKYILIYSVSLLLVFVIWYREILIESRLDKINELRIEDSTESVEESAEGWIRGGDTIVVQPPPQPIQYVESPKGVFDYINEILTLVIGLINIIAFGYQMKDRRTKLNEQNN